MRFTMRDHSLPHQIVIFKRTYGSKIAVSCLCMRKGQSHVPLESRVLWQPGEAMKTWFRHMERIRNDEGRES
jgi:hypothetical protein